MQETAYHRKNNAECFKPRDRLTCMSLVSSSIDVVIERSITHEKFAKHVREANDLADLVLRTRMNE
jgi:hypothetical protein